MTRGEGHSSREGSAGREGIAGGLYRDLCGDISCVTSFAEISFMTQIPPSPISSYRRRRSSESLEKLHTYTTAHVGEDTERERILRNGEMSESRGRMRYVHDRF